jgi:LPXTG-motif cell wall-anchored protein
MSTRDTTAADRGRSRFAKLAIAAGSALTVVGLASPASALPFLDVKVNPVPGGAITVEFDCDNPDFGQARAFLVQGETMLAQDSVKGSEDWVTLELTIPANVAPGTELSIIGACFISEPDEGGDTGAPTQIASYGPYVFTVGTPNTTTTVAPTTTAAPATTAAPTTTAAPSTVAPTTAAPTTAAPTTVVAAAGPTTTVRAVLGGTLPATGSSTGSLVWLGAASILAGVALLVRRRTALD